MKRTHRDRKFVVVLLCSVPLFLIHGCGTASYRASAVSEDFTRETEEETVSAGAALMKDTEGKKAAASFATESAGEPASICVYICGAVRKPGVYHLPEFSRVYELIGMAGGLSAEADPVFLNQAQMLSDGEQITVLTKEQTEGLGPSGGNAAAPGVTGQTGQQTGGRININTADAEELQQLNGIGASRSQDIIAYRESSGGFTCIEDIMKVSGIKHALFEKIRDDITVG